MSVFEALLAKTAVAQERNRVPYMVIDGQAVLVHGEPRFTGDIDITLGVDTGQQENIRRIARELSLEPIQGMTNDVVERNALLTCRGKRDRHCSRLYILFSSVRAPSHNAGGRRFDR